MILRAVRNVFKRVTGDRHCIEATGQLVWNHSIPNVAALCCAAAGDVAGKTEPAWWEKVPETASPNFLGLGLVWALELLPSDAMSLVYLIYPS